MKIQCPHCNSERKADEKGAATVSVCPFCGQDLKKHDKPQSVPKAMRSVIERYGRRILKEGARLYAFLTDYIPEKEKELRIIKVACNSGVYSAFADAEKSEYDSHKLRAIHTLTNDYFLSDNWAEAAVAWLLEALGAKVSQPQRVSSKDKQQETSVTQSTVGRFEIEFNGNDKIGRAFNLISQKLYLAAEKILKEELLWDANNGQLYLGLLLCDLEICSTDLLRTVKWDYSNNVNYMKACRFLDSKTKSKLQQCCEENKGNLANRNVSLQKINTSLMQEFTRANTVNINGQPFTVVALLTNVNFSKLSDDEIIMFYRNVSERMEKIIKIYNRMSFEEKNSLEYSDPAQTERAIALFMQLKAIMMQIDGETD